MRYIYGKNLKLKKFYKWRDDSLRKTVGIVADKRQAIEMALKCLEYANDQEALGDLNITLFLNSYEAKSMSDVRTTFTTYKPGKSKDKAWII